MGLVRASEKRRKAPGRARGLSYGNLNKTGKKQTRQQRRTDRTTRHSLRRKHKVHRPGRKKEVVCKKGFATKKEAAQHEAEMKRSSKIRGKLLLLLHRGNRLSLPISMTGWKAMQE